MHPTMAGALRAHLVLLAAATCLVSAAAVVLVAMLDLPLNDPGPGARTSLLGIALLLVIYLWARAHQAFRSALRAHLVAASAASPNGVCIADRCRHAWLVQLYVELFPTLSQRALALDATRDAGRAMNVHRYAPWKRFQPIKFKRR